MNFDTDQWALIVSVASLVLALAVVILPPVRRRVSAQVAKISQLVGTDRRRYVSWFRTTYGIVHNVYLDRHEELTLEDTFVPLAAYSESETERVSAVDVLSNAANARVIIVGDPGSGKSTLLKAFGASSNTSTMSKASRLRRMRVRQTAIFVPLRILARSISGKDSSDGQLSLRHFIEHEIFTPAGVRRPDVLLSTLLSSKLGVVLLLDGLDEVPDTARTTLRASILSFIQSNEVRVVLTCRRQNFLTLRSDWIPVLADKTYTLARLKDDEVRAFISRREREFEGNRTPTDLYESIVQSGTLELHRVPLILTVSIGLYIRLPGYRIPTSLASFYDEMIKQLVTRHDFRLEVSGSVNRFAADDKIRFLREFAYRAAERTGQFEDFTLIELIQNAESMFDRLPSMQRGEGEVFINEIIDRSGLVVQSSLESDYVFAHRSIQEFLIARRLLGNPEAGARLLRDHADNAEWRLVGTFFASFEHDYVEYFIKELRMQHLVFCARCLVVANISDRMLVADIISDLVYLIDSRPIDESTEEFGALIGLANGLLPWIRDEAVAAILSRLNGSTLAIAEFLALDQDSTSRLFAGLARSTSPRVVEIVERLAELPSADSAQSIPYLWLIWCRADGRVRATTRALLGICRTQSTLDILQNQPRDIETALDNDILKAVYPFKNAQPLESNLPFMLGRAKVLELPLDGINRYLDAMVGGDQHLLTLESDHLKRLKAIYLYWPARVLTIAAAPVSVLVIGLSLFEHGWRSLLIAPGVSWWWNLSYFAPAALSVLLAFVLASLPSDRIPKALSLPGEFASIRWAYDSSSIYEHVVNRRDKLVLANRRIDSLDTDAGLDSDGRPFWDLDTCFLGLRLMPFVLPVIAATHQIFMPTTLADIAVYVVVATLAAWITFFFPAVYACGRGVPIYVRRHNPLLWLYDDPKCRHWILPG